MDLFLFLTFYVKTSAIPVIAPKYTQNDGDTAAHMPEIKQNAHGMSNNPLYDDAKFGFWWFCMLFFFKKNLFILRERGREREKNINV